MTPVLTGDSVIERENGFFVWNGRDPLEGVAKAVYIMLVLNNGIELHYEEFLNLTKRGHFDKLTAPERKRAYDWFLNIFEEDLQKAREEGEMLKVKTSRQFLDFELDPNGISIVIELASDPKGTWFTNSGINNVSLSNNEKSSFLKIMANPANGSANASRGAVGGFLVFTLRKMVSKHLFKLSGWNKDGGLFIVPERDFTGWIPLAMCGAIENKYLVDLNGGIVYSRDFTKNQTPCAIEFTKLPK